MKVNDLKRQLDEGFLDNLVSKIQSMAGGDGPTGIIRALRGQDAALRKFADAITNATRNKVMQRLGNQIDSINAGEAPLPVKMIYQQAISAATQIAAADQMNVDVGLVGQTIKSNRADIERLVLSSNVGDNNQIKLILDSILGGTGSANIGMEVEPAMRAVSMLVAATVVFIQTSQEDSANTEVDENALEAFKTATATLNKVLFIQNSPDLQTLSPNDQLKDHLEELVTINVLTNVQKRYLSMSIEQIRTAIASVPQLVNPAALSRLLSSHAPTVDPSAVSAVVAKVEPLIQAQFKAWLEIAVAEQPPRAKSFDIYKQWAAAVYQTLDSMNFDAPPAAVAQAENNPEFKALEDSHTAGEEAVKSALASNPGLSGSEMKQIYDRARANYDKANPTA